MPLLSSKEEQFTYCNYYYLASINLRVFLLTTVDIPRPEIWRYLPTIVQEAQCITMSTADFIAAG